MVSAHILVMNDDGLDLLLDGLSGENCVLHQFHLEVEIEAGAVEEPVRQVDRGKISLNFDGDSFFLCIKHLIQLFQ